MGTAFRAPLLLVVSCLILSACAPSGSLLIPGELARPARDVAAPAGAPQAVVADFSHPVAPDGVVGRDFDGVRPIVWNGNPGKAMADLIAGALGESGVAAVRPGADAKGAEAATVRISGVVRRFEVNIRRNGGIKVITEATVSVTVTTQGPGPSGPSEQTVTSSLSLSDIFVTPDGVREVLMSASNAVAEEVARKLVEGRVFPPSAGQDGRAR